MTEERARDWLIRHHETAAVTPASQRAFVDAARQGDLARVEAWLAIGMPADARGKDGFPALPRCTGKQDVAERLLAAGASLASRNAYGTTAFMDAVYRRAWAQAERYADLGCHVDARDAEGRTALILCATRADTVGFLLKVGARHDVVSASAHAPRTALGVAAVGHGSPKRGAVERLLAAGADPWLGGRGSAVHSTVREGVDDGLAMLLRASPRALDGALGVTLLCLALRHGRPTTAAQLVALGAPGDQADPRGWTAAQLATLHEVDVPGLEAAPLPDTRALDAAWKKDKAALEQAIADGVDLELHTKTGLTALQIAARGNQLEQVELLLDAGVRIDGRRGASTALSTAAARGHDAIVARLLDAGARNDPPGRTGWTALHAAAANGHVAVVEQLLAADADPTLRTDLGASALDEALQQGHGQVVPLLLAHGAELHTEHEGLAPIDRAFRRMSRGPGLEALLDAGADPFRVAGCGQSTAQRRAHRAIDQRPFFQQLFASSERRGVPPTAADLAGAVGTRDIAWFEAVLPTVDIDLGPALVYAVADRNESLVALLLDAGAPPETVDWEGRTALGAAARSGWEAGVERLLSAGAKVEPLPGGPYPVDDAAAGGHDRLVARLLAAGARVQGLALHEASHGGHADTVLQLLDHGAPVDARDGTGRTPLMRAAAAGHTAVVRRLLDAGADRSLRDDADRTPADHAGAHHDVLTLVSAAPPPHQNLTPIAIPDLVRHAYTGDLRRLTKALDAGAPVDTTTSRGDTALLVAGARDDRTMMRRLLERGADPTLVNVVGEGLTDLCHPSDALEGLFEGRVVLSEERHQAWRTAREALHKLVVAGVTRELCEALTDQRADPNLPVGYRDSLLLDAIHADRSDQVVALLAAGALPQAMTRHGDHPLVRAADRGLFDAVVGLLEAGADPDASDARGTALERAIGSHHAGDLAAKLVGALLSAGADATTAPAHDAARCGHGEALERMLDAGFPLDGRDDNDDALVACAAEGGRPAVVERLLARGVDPEHRSHGCTPLWTAAANDRAGVVRLLAARGADVDAVDTSPYGDRHRVLETVAWRGHTAMAQVLLELGATRWRGSAATLAQEHGHDRLAELLAPTPDDGGTGPLLRAQLTRLGVAAAPLRRPCPDAVPSALWALTWGHAWPQRVTWSNAESDDPRVWGLYLGLWSPVPPGKVAGDPPMVELGHYDGGNYAIAVRLDDPAPWDPAVHVLDHDQTGHRLGRGPRLSDLLRTVERDEDA